MMISEVKDIYGRQCGKSIERKIMVSELKTRFSYVFLINCSTATEHRKNLRFAQNCREGSCVSNSLVEIKNTSCLPPLARQFCKALLGTPVKPIEKFFLSYIRTCPGLVYTMTKTRTRQLFPFSSYSTYNNPSSILKWIVEYFCFCSRFQSHIFND